MTGHDRDYADAAYNPARPGSEPSSCGPRDALRTSAVASWSRGSPSGGIVRMTGGSGHGDFRWRDRCTGTMSRKSATSVGTTRRWTWNIFGSWRVLPGLWNGRTVLEDVRPMRAPAEEW
uniref:(northern house mosquito) hypothetical protein n=1 Tax=Culex pipiens TaxID=7175 RepID=A0A8D8I3U0_CULPI